MLNSLIRRRQLLQRLAIGSLVLKFPAALAQTSQPTPRVAALDWTAVELLYALQLSPCALTDRQGYHDWVVAPQLPSKTVELGLRNEPNLELLSQLHPDLIIVPDASALPITRLQQFGPVWHYPFILPGKKLLTIAENNTHQLANLLGRETQASSYLSTWHETMQQIRDKLSPFQSRRILLYSFLTPRQVLVLSPSSLFGEVMEKLNLRCAWQGTANIWGSAIVGIEQLFSTETDIAIEFTHGERGNTARTATSGLWQQMPFIKQNKNYVLDSAWIYGGLEAAQRFAQQLLTVSRTWHE